MVSNFDSAKARAQPAADRQGGGRFSFEGVILADGGSWQTRQSSKSIFSAMTTFHVSCKWLTSVDRYSFVSYGTKACGWNPRFLHSFEPKGLSGREREGKTDKRSTVCVGGSPKIDPSSCRVDQMRTIHGGVFRLINSTLHSVSSKVTGKLVVSLQPFQ